MDRLLQASHHRRPWLTLQLVSSGKHLQMLTPVSEHDIHVGWHPSILNKNLISFP